MLTRTYPAEYDTFSGDEVIINAIRDKIGDRLELKRYILSSGSETVTDFVMSDSQTFYDSDTRFWPYHLTYSGITYSGVTNPQVLNYHYMQFSNPVDLTTNTSDFWVETFYLSDFEIWTAYLSVDLTPLVTSVSCITEDMNIIKAAIDLVPSLRSAKARYFYGGMEVRDNDTTFRQSELKYDPFKDLIDKLQKELDDLLYECNNRLYQGGYRIE